MRVTARERGLALNDISWNQLTTLVPTKHTNEDVSCIPSRYTKIELRFTTIDQLDYYLFRRLCIITIGALRDCSTSDWSGFCEIMATTVEIGASSVSLTTALLVPSPMPTI